MDSKPLGIMNIVFHTLKRRPFRATGPILLVALSAPALFGRTTLSQGMENGMGNLSKGTGADILTVSYGYEADIQSTLPQREPSAFYFDAGMTEKVESTEGVEAVFLQFYIATLSTGCCSYPFQLIGFDPKTDFIIRPWMSGLPEHSFVDGEIVIGSNISVEMGQKLKFLDQIYLATACPDKTDMSLDSSVFMNLATTKQMVRGPERIQAHPVAENDNLISSIIIEIKSGYIGKDVANNILRAYTEEDVHVAAARNMISSISGNLRGLTTYILILAGVLWVLAVGVLIIVFFATLDGRKREFSIFRVLGATRSRLVKLILYESCLINIFGTVTGMIAAVLVAFPLSTYTNISLALPCLQSSPGALPLMAALSFLISFATGPIASAYAAAQIGSSEIYTMMKEGE